MTTVLRLTDDPVASDQALHVAAEALRQGRLVAFPTETVYGLGACATNATAVRAIFEAKGRPANNPLIVHVAEVIEIPRLVAAWPPLAEQLAQCFWPGPLTLVLPKDPDLPDVVTAHGPTVAIRIPSHPIARRLLELAGVPVAAPSANRSGEISPTTADHVLRSLGGRIDFVIDGGPTTVGLESTVLSFVEDPPRLLRPGHITASEIEAVIGPIRRMEGITRITEGPFQSPGMMARHYAPRTPVTASEQGGTELAEALARRQAAVGLLTWRSPAHPLPASVHVRVLPSEPAAFAARMYDVMHEMDAMGLDHLVIELPPATEAWAAVRDRLSRAAAQD